MKDEALQKVACFITRTDRGQTQLLLFEHPNAGIQFPAGTVEPGESIESAAAREAFEETGIRKFKRIHMIGGLETKLPEKQFAVVSTAYIHFRPDASSEVWGRIRGGLQVTEVRRATPFVQVTYEEEDKYPNPNYISFQVTGWVHQTHLSATLARTFFHLEAENDGRQEWFHAADGHRFRLFWSPLDRLPAIVEPQYQWWTYVTEELKYSFTP